MSTSIFRNRLSVQALFLISIIVLSAACTSQKAPYEDALEGRVKRKEVGIASKVPGRILEIRVSETDTVMKGDTLAIINVPEVEAKLKQAEGAWLAAKAKYEMALNGATPEQKEQVNALFEAAKEQFQLAEKTYERMKHMYQDTLISPQKFDEVQAKYEAARAQMKQAHAKQKEVTTGVRKERIQMARGQLKRAQGAMEEAQNAYNERFITAPTLMSVETIALEEGELALPGYTFITGYKQQSTYIRFTVPESDINNFGKGKIYTIQEPFNNQRTFDAKLVEMKQLASYANQSSAYPQYEMGEAIFEIHLEPIDPTVSQQLYTNTTALLSSK